MKLTSGRRLETGHLQPMRGVRLTSPGAEDMAGRLSSDGKTVSGTDGPPPLRTFVGFVLRLLGCFAIIGFWCAGFVVYEATPAGPARVWMWGAGLLLLPILWILGEVVPNPLLQYLEARPWWRDGSSSMRVGLGVLAVLPFFAFVVAITWALRHWLDIGGW